MFACRKSTQCNFWAPRNFLIGAPLIALAVLKIELSTSIRAISVTRSIDCNGFSVLHHVFRVAYAPFVFTIVLEPFLVLLQQPLIPPFVLFSLPLFSSHFFSSLLSSGLLSSPFSYARTKAKRGPLLTNSKIAPRARTALFQSASTAVFTLLLRLQ